MTFTWTLDESLKLGYFLKEATCDLNSSLRFGEHNSMLPWCTLIPHRPVNGTPSLRMLCIVDPLHFGRYLKKMFWKGRVVNWLKEKCISWLGTSGCPEAMKYCPSNHPQYMLLLIHKHWWYDWNPCMWGLWPKCSKEKYDFCLDILRAWSPNIWNDIGPPHHARGKGRPHMFEMPVWKRRLVGQCKRILALTCATYWGAWIQSGFLFLCVKTVTFPTLIRIKCLRLIKIVVLEFRTC